MDSALKLDRLRSLDSFEEHFWLMEKVTARGHELVATVSGVADEHQWRKAFDTVRQRHPFLNVSIGKEPGERPFFHRVANRQLPLELRECLSRLTAVEITVAISFPAPRFSVAVPISGAGSTNTVIDGRELTVFCTDSPNRVRSKRYSAARQ